MHGNRKRPGGRAGKGLRHGGVGLVMALAVLGLDGAPAYGAQHALVVGINQYQHGGAGLDDRPTYLLGAVNDAILIRDALRDAGVNLPDERVLLNEKATREDLVRGWRAMREQATPGDTLILTYSGHGGQESEWDAPLDEADGFDETLMLYDFDPEEPLRGRVTDDELSTWLRDANDVQVLVVSDSCHSGGLMRTHSPAGRSRYGGSWRIRAPSPPPPATAAAHGDEEPWLPHVTFILGASSDSLQIHETILGGRPHGALSWYFARAMQGAADRDRNGALTRAELEAYLTERVRTHTQHAQTPRLLPRGDASPVVMLANARSGDVAQAPGACAEVCVRVDGGEPPSDVGGRRVYDMSYDLKFVIDGGSAHVINATGGQLAMVGVDDGHAWNRIITGMHLRKAVAGVYDPGLAPVDISLPEGDGEHTGGAVLHFSVAPGAGVAPLNALTLFNLSGEGGVQFLYPVRGHGDPVAVSVFPYRLPAIQIRPPFGGEFLVAVLCEAAPRSLHRLLMTAGQIPQAMTPQAFRASIAGYRCQVGQYAFFTRPGHR